MQHMSGFQGGVRACMQAMHLFELGTKGSGRSYLKGNALVRCVRLNKRAEATADRKCDIAWHFASRQP